MRKKNGADAIIVVAEDDEDHRLFAREALEVADLANNLQFVEDGEQLLDYLYHRGEFEDPTTAPRPDLILLDLNMPRKSGHQVLQEIRSDPTLEDIPVVVLTSSDAEEDMTRSYDLGAYLFLTKPVTLAGLVEAIRNLRRDWFDSIK